VGLFARAAGNGPPTLIPPRAHLVREAEAVSDPQEVAERPHEAAERGRARNRRLVRWTAIVTGVILAVLACWQDPLYAI
jgi:hypothetical protein